MPIRARVETRGKFTSPIKRLDSELTQRFTKSANLAFKTVAPLFLTDVANYPPPSKHPFQWSSDPSANRRAQQWWFAKVSSGQIATSGNRYIRSKQLAKSFKPDLVLDGGNAAMVIKSNARDSKGRFRYRWVVGTFAKRDGKRWQIIGHKRTGWFYIQDVTNKWLLQFGEIMTREFGQVDVNIRNR